MSMTCVNFLTQLFNSTRTQWLQKVTIMATAHIREVNPVWQAEASAADYPDRLSVWIRASRSGWLQLLHTFGGGTNGRDRAQKLTNSSKLHYLQSSDSSHFIDLVTRGMFARFSRLVDHRRNFLRLIFPKRRQARNYCGLISYNTPKTTVKWVA